MKFEPAEILSILTDLTGCRSLVVAYSGGLDSMVLLHAVVELRSQGRLPHSVRALHINHGLNVAADSWQQVCEQTCQRLEVELQCVQVAITEIPGRSLEELARDARYQVFREQLGSGDCLLMAHQLDDEMENLLLRLTRGSGPGALSGIPRTRSLGEATLIRPLLAYPREALERYAQQHNLQWLEDDSNTDTAFDRNFWRHEILPLISRRFPGFRQSWSKSMMLCSEADQLQQELAAGDLAGLATNDPRVLNVGPLLNFSEHRQRNVLRYWMLQLGFQPPGWQLMQRLTNEILVSSKAGACLECAAGLVQRFGNHLVLLSAGSNASLPVRQQSWKPGLDQVLQLDDNGELRVAFSAGSATADTVDNRCRVKVDIDELVVRYRQQGERCRLSGRPTRSLKKILQDSTLPPWLRRRQPLLYAGDELVCIPGVGVCEGYAAGPDQPGQEIFWQPPDLLYRSQ